MANMVVLSGTILITPKCNKIKKETLRDLELATSKTKDVKDLKKLENGAWFSNSLTYRLAFRTWIKRPRAHWK